MHVDSNANLAILNLCHLGQVILTSLGLSVLISKMEE